MAQSSLEMSLHEKLAQLPDKPGVYLFRDSAGQILYVGKARSLKNRVSTYFQKESAGNPRLQLLLGKACDLDSILCDSEMEALLLEYNLIKEHHPPYNIRFRDDKRFPFIKVVLTDPFPYMTIVRKRENDKNRYFGPFVSSQAMRETLKILRKIFQIRSCTMKITGHDRPCLYYHLKECTAPCISKINREEYRKTIEGAIQFLEGRGETLIKELKNSMETSAENLRFEQAAGIRDQIESLEKALLRQKVVSERGQDEDYVGVASKAGLYAGEVFHVRQGRLIGKEEVVFESAEVSEESNLQAFLEKYYQERGPIPTRILLSREIPEIGVLEKFLSEKAGSPVQVEMPKRGEKKRMLDLLEKNARHSLEMALLKEMRMQGMMEALESLQKLFHLPVLPFRIEGYDISTLFGRESVGSMVVFRGGKPEKKDYRKFFIAHAAAPDDFAMMEEMLMRRFQHFGPSGTPLPSQSEDSSFSAVPDLILLDGGRGQLSVGVKVLKRFPHLRIPILSLAKEEEEIYHPEFSKPVQLSRHHSGLKLLQQVRDEAHRFAVTYHKARRDKQVSRSTLETVPGIGEKRARKLLTAFGSLDQIKVAEPARISQVLQCSRSLADKVLSTVLEF